ncbi:MAG: alpha/beta hydrolase-fold protein [Planctomycetota bacterium]
MRFVAALLTMIASPAFAHPGEDTRRVEVEFSVTHETTFGESVFILGERPELGGDDMRLAVLMVPTSYPTWTARVALPQGAEHTYRFVTRSTSDSTFKDPANGTVISGDVTTTAPSAPDAPPPNARTFFYETTWVDPILWYSERGEPHQAVPMQRVGAGRAPGTSRWVARHFGRTHERVSLHIKTNDGSQRFPPSDIQTDLDVGFINDTPGLPGGGGGEAFAYVPAVDPAPGRRDYDPINPPSIQSTNLGGETRRYRVWLPRGYDEHPDRRYPVLYMHDGQNVFESGPFGSWNAENSITLFTRLGLVRELIVVGVDNTANRFANYIPPDDGGQADDYAAFVIEELKPLIDAQYRTIPDAAHTGIAGSSLGGLCSLYFGWDHPDTFGRVGAFSSSLQFNNFPDRVASEPSRDLRLYLDAGDTSDGLQRTLNLHANLMGRATEPYTRDADTQLVIGFNQAHNEAAWAARLPWALNDLFPATETQRELLVTGFAPAYDLNADGGADIDDLHAWHETPSDVNFDGAANDTDRQRLEAYLRRAELGRPSRLAETVR